MKNLHATLPTALSAALLEAVLLAPAPAAAQAAQALPVPALATPPKVDGDLAEWGSEGWLAVAVRPALERKDRPRYGLDEADDQNHTGSLTVQIKAGIADGRLFIAVRYPDSREDKDTAAWEWRDGRYVQSRRSEDQFAVRFHLAGDYDRSMLSARDYRADVWLWSAGRSNPTGVADDYSHSFTTRSTEDAAEYSLPGGKTAYIRKPRDAGRPAYRSLPAPREHKGDRLPAFEAQKATGSAADVAARGQWKAGFWSLEFARALHTGQADDVVFVPGQKLLGQIAVFNHGRDEHKSVSEPVLFEFAPPR
ncbi:Ethylbenzene dehydrogenase [Rubrivivax sp. A210]|uniref:ethylbenzene dehydrogenase-related protein n=1 Tax=Rubrivivax sp. A210 TaxID=2772301 RepID=UPI0019180096|nr:ethylbenzene dehydrogenase-related protein [Rubrivivax sp. A210]CAD5374434.1 Ethylbenzene dehydrogenase [Rubrivivax sp. A210]